MQFVPEAISDIDDAESARVLLFSSTKTPHAPLVSLVRAAAKAGAISAEDVTFDADGHPGTTGLALLQDETKDDARDTLQIPKRNVKWFGAAGDGVTDDLTAFQAAIDATPDGTNQIFEVPAGEYVGDLSTLDIGNRNILWVEDGDVSYPTASPPGVRYGANVIDSVAGSVGFGVYNTEKWLNKPALGVSRRTTHTTGIIGTAEPSALHVHTDVDTDVDNFETAAHINIDVNTKISIPRSFTALRCQARKQDYGGVDSGANMFGFNPSAADLTGRASNLSGGVLVVQENDITCSGPDNANSRSMLDLIAREHTTSPDGATSVAYGLRVYPSRGTAWGPVEIKNAVWVGEDGHGSVRTGVNIANCTERGLFVGGPAPSVAAIDVYHDSGAAVIRAGSQIQSGLVGQLSFWGQNDSDGAAMTGRLRANMDVATTGSHTGSLAIDCYDAGTIREVFGAHPDQSSDNPISIRVGGSFKRITQGAPDSAGTGFRQLRVPN